MRRLHPAVIMAAALAGLSGGGMQGFVEAQRGLEAQRAQMASLKFQPGAPTETTAKRSNSFAWLRGLMRAGRQRRTFRGLPMSVAQGKRVARKIRNRQRQKKQWKAHVR